MGSRMTYECFEVDVSDHVAHIVLTRGDQLNTMTPAFWRDLPLIVNEISDAGEARAIVISSTGKHFCAGMDLAVFTGGGGLAGDAQAEVGRLRANLRLSARSLQESLSSL